MPRNHTLDIVQRAQMNNFKAMVLTIDEPVLRLSYGDQYAFANFSYPNFQSNNTLDEDPSQSWEDVAWLKRHTTLPLVVKGLLEASQVKDALDAGVDAIIVSNHGGRWDKHIVIQRLRCHDVPLARVAHRDTLTAWGQHMDAITMTTVCAPQFELNCKCVSV